MTHIRFAWAVAAAAMLVAGCSGTPDSGGKVVLTQHQRDSVLSKSVLPGAIVVDRALRVSAKASDRSADFGASMDSLPQ